MVHTDVSLSVQKLQWASSQPSRTICQRWAASDQGIRVQQQSRWRKAGSKELASCFAARAHRRKTPDVQPSRIVWASSGFTA